VTRVLGAGVDHSFGTVRARVRLDGRRTVELFESVARQDVAERPAPVQGEVGEVRDVMTAAHRQGDPVPRALGDARDHFRKEANRFRGRTGKLSVADLDEEGGKAERGTVMGRFVRGSRS